MGVSLFEKPPYIILYVRFTLLYREFFNVVKSREMLM